MRRWIQRLLPSLVAEEALPQQPEPQSVEVTPPQEEEFVQQFPVVLRLLNDEDLHLVKFLQGDWRSQRRGGTLDQAQTLIDEWMVTPGATHSEICLQVTSDKNPLMLFAIDLTTELEQRRINIGKRQMVMYIDQKPFTKNLLDHVTGVPSVLFDRVVKRVCLMLQARVILIDIDHAKSSAVVVLETVSEFGWSLEDVLNESNRSAVESY